MNRRIFGYDLAVIVGPVFPHEVVGMSGGWKYFFPGIAGVEVINQSHWLGALIGISDIIGRSETPVRRMVEKAGEMVGGRLPVVCLSLVLGQHDLRGLYFGDPVASHRAAAALSRDVNILWTDRRYRRVVAECPIKYDELWTGGKLAYKTQEVVEQGGEIVMYAPHLDKIAPQHPDVEKVGYHCLAYFRGQGDRFKDVEASSIAHSTHVAGPGTYSGGEEVALRRAAFWRRAFRPGTARRSTWTTSTPRPSRSSTVPPSAMTRTCFGCRRQENSCSCPRRLGLRSQACNGSRNTGSRSPSGFL